MAKKTDAGTTRLTALVRQELGKGASRRARRDGQVPAVLYGHGTTPRHLTLPARDLATVLRYSGTNAVLTLDIEGSEQLALTKSLVIHPIRRNIEHLDLLVVRRGEKVTVEVTVTVTGEPDAGALVTQESSTVEVEAEALSIPESLEVSVDGVGAGTQITAAELALPAGVTLVSDPELLVVNVVEPPTAAELEAEGGGASLEEQAEAAAESDAEAPGADAQ